MLTRRHIPKFQVVKVKSAYRYLYYLLVTQPHRGEPPPLRFFFENGWLAEQERNTQYMSTDKWRWLFRR
jgi:hypothetical protein